MAAPARLSWSPRYYDECLGPVWFGPFALDLARRVAVHPPGDVLEIACGTGLATRALRERLQRDVHLVASDLSRDMLAYARGRLGAAGGIAWCGANAMRLPFGDGTFGALVCGFAMMFMPDRNEALREARRVLMPGGAFVFNVWDRMDENLHARVAGETLSALFPGEPALAIGIGYDMGDPARLRLAVEAAGFRAIRIETRRIAVHCDDPRTIATGLVRGTPRAALLARRGASLDNVIDEVARALTHAGGFPYRSHAQAVVVEAIAA